MKNYKKIPFNRIKDIESYVGKKLKAGHIIIRIAVNEDKKEISELVMQMIMIVSHIIGILLIQMNS